MVNHIFSIVTSKMPTPSAEDTDATSKPQTGHHPHREVLPRKGLLFTESQSQLILCKPKLLPMKSFTLQKMEEMQQEAKRKANKQRQKASRLWKVIILGYMFICLYYGKFTFQTEKEEERERENSERGNFVSESVSFE